MLAGKIHDLRHFGFGNFVCKNATLPDPMMMHMQHDLRCCFNILLEEFFQHVDDEFHWRIIIVQNENAIKIWTLRFRLNLGDNGRPRATTTTGAIIFPAHSRYKARMKRKIPGLLGDTERRLDQFDV